jgi:hypothetical protein
METLPDLLVHGADVELFTRLHHAHDVNTSQASGSTMGTKGVSRLFDAVLDDFCQIMVVEASVLASLETTKDPLLGWGLCEVVTESLQRSLVSSACVSKENTYHVDLRHQLRRHVVDVSQLRDRLADDFLHPLVVGGTESGVPVVKNAKLGRNHAAGTALEALATSLDFRTEIEPPFGVGTRGVEDSCYVILQHYGSEEANVDVSGQLEDVIVLPVLIESQPLSLAQRFRLSATYHFFSSSLSLSQSRYLSSSLMEKRFLAILL